MPEPQSQKSWEKQIQELMIRQKQGQFGDYGLSAYDGKIQGFGTYILSKLLDVGGGDIVGYPVQEWCKQNPLVVSDDYQVNIVLAPNKQPPFTKSVMVGGKRTTIGIAQVTIPSPVVDLTYEKIRYACGDKNGLPWGNHIARAYVSRDGETEKRFGQRQIVAKGQSAAGALRNLDRMLTLYDIGEGTNKGKVLDKRPSHGQDEKQGRRDMYPAWIWIHKPSLLHKPDKLKKIKIYIFEEKEPESFKQQLQTILQE